MSSTDTVSPITSTITPKLIEIDAQDSEGQLLLFKNITIQEEDFASDKSFSFLIAQNVKENQEISIDGTCEIDSENDRLSVSMGLDNYPDEETESLVIKTFINFDEVAMKTFRKNGNLIIIPSEGFYMRKIVFEDGMSAFIVSKK
jgi:hypothetical protein